MFVFGATGLWFKSRAVQIGHSVAKGLPPLKISSKRTVLPAGAMTRKKGHKNSLHACRNIASITKGLIGLIEKIRLIHYAPFTLATTGCTTNWVKIQCDADKICVIRSNARPRPSVKGAIQINAIIWCDIVFRLCAMRSFI